MLGAGLGGERPSRNEQRLASLAARVSAVGDGVLDERFRRSVAAARLFLIGLRLRGVESGAGGFGGVSFGLLGIGPCGFGSLTHGGISFQVRVADVVTHLTTS